MPNTRADALRQDLKEDPSFYPLLDEMKSEREEDWAYLCQHTLEELDLVPVETKPLTEQKLFEAQRRFYANRGDDVAIADMFSIMIPYASSLILKNKKNSRFIDKAVLHTMAREVSLRVSSQFLRRPGFNIQASFGGYIKWKILEVTGEADDFERTDQIDPTTKRKKKIPLLSLNAITDKARHTEASLEDLQESLSFTNLGNAPIDRRAMSTDLQKAEVVNGILRIVDSAIAFIEHNADNDMEAYLDTLFTVTALHSLFAHGIRAYTDYRAYAPSVRIGRLVDETTHEVLKHLLESEKENHIDE